MSRKPRPDFPSRSPGSTRGRRITATNFVTAIGALFQKYDDILGHREHKDTEKNTLQGAPLCLSVSVACPNQYVGVITKFCTKGQKSCVTVACAAGVMMV